jgi:hypothetical protein
MKPMMVCLQQHLICQKCSYIKKCPLCRASYQKQNICLSVDKLKLLQLEQLLLKRRKEEFDPRGQESSGAVFSAVRFEETEEGQLMLVSFVIIETEGWSINIHNCWLPVWAYPSGGMFKSRDGLEVVSYYKQYLNDGKQLRRVRQALHRGLQDQGLLPSAQRRVFFLQTLHAARSTGTAP